MHITKNKTQTTKKKYPLVVCVLYLIGTMEFVSFFQSIVLICSSFFGLYLMFRMLGKQKIVGFYIFWILSGAMMFLTFLSLKLEILNFEPILYRAIAPLFFLAPPSLYLFFLSLLGTSIARKRIIIHLIPFGISLLYSLFIILFQKDETIRQVMVIQQEITNPHYKSSVPPFAIETIFYLFRSLLGLYYMRLTGKMLSTANNARILNGWTKLFQPIRINLYLVALLFVTYQFLLKFFDYQINRYYFINGTTLLAAAMLFWHILLVIRDLENTDSIFKGEYKSPTPIIHAPEKLLFILNQINQQKMYQDPLVSVGSIAIKFNMSEEKFAAEFNNNIPFSFSSYINYLRLINFEKNSNSKYSKEANILNAGFNSRASYYQWEKRRPKLAIQIDPFLESFEPLVQV